MELRREEIRYLRAANDDAETGIVPAHLAARRMQRRIMTIAALLAVGMLTSAITGGHSAVPNVPDLLISAFRV